MALSITVACLISVAGLIVYMIILYNNLIGLRVGIDKAWSNIDVLLKQRFDELPKLVKVCRGYITHERKTLEAVIAARSMIASAGTGEERIQSENTVTDALRSLLAVAEQYPQLKADSLFTKLSMRISEIEEQIADRREMYNESVTVFNVRLEQFPDIIIARGLGYGPRDMWKIDASHRGDVNIDL